MKTRAVDRSCAKNYLKRAEECKDMMYKAFELEDWTACVINAIHCAISSADAVCVSKLGLRNASENHRDAIALFISINPKNEGIKRGAKHLSRLLSIKTDSEYGERLNTQREAEESIKHAERLFDFAKRIVESIA